MAYYRVGFQKLRFKPLDNLGMACHTRARFTHETDIKFSLVNKKWCWEFTIACVLHPSVTLMFQMLVISLLRPPLTSTLETACLWSPKSMRITRLSRWNWREQWYFYDKSRNQRERSTVICEILTRLGDLALIQDVNSDVTVYCERLRELWDEGGYVHMVSAGSCLWICRVDTSAYQHIIPFQYVTAHMSVHSNRLGGHTEWVIPHESVAKFLAELSIGGWAAAHSRILMQVVMDLLVSDTWAWCSVAGSCALVSRCCPSNWIDELRHLHLDVSIDFMAFSLMNSSSWWLKRERDNSSEKERRWCLFFPHFHVTTVPCIPGWENEGHLSKVTGFSSL